jgi:hypothetical protein
MSPGTIRDKQNERWRAAEDHIRCEAAHDLDALVDTFGPNAEWHMIKSETAYYDRLTILEQLGVLAS